MTTFAARLAAARLKLRELPCELTIRQASRLLAGAGGTAQSAWGRLLADAVAAGELPALTVNLPPRRYDRLATMNEIERQKPRTERRIRLADLEEWLQRIGAPRPPWIELSTPELRR